MTRKPFRGLSNILAWITDRTSLFQRLFIAMQSVRCARVCLEDSIEYAMSRETFGKKLTDHRKCD